VDLEIIDPVVRILPHLIRNSLSHGFEEPSERLQTAKPERGILRLCVGETKDHYILQVGDDGRGINPEIVGQAALAKKIVTAEALRNMSDREKQWLIFTPSFSTDDEATDISGRGVGLEVVLESVKAAHATLTLDSRVGHGAVFTITLSKDRSVGFPAKQAA
jgi:two-component system chemotaxis sensor kinase CheA